MITRDPKLSVRDSLIFRAGKAKGLRNSRIMEARHIQDAGIVRAYVYSAREWNHHMIRLLVEAKR